MFRRKTSDNDIDCYIEELGRVALCNKIICAYRETPSGLTYIEWAKIILNKEGIPDYISVDGIMAILYNELHDEYKKYKKETKNEEVR